MRSIEPGRAEFEPRRRVLWLRERFRWMGQHSGYDRLFQMLAEHATLESFSVYKDEAKRPPFPWRTALSLVRRIVRGTPAYASNSVVAELHALVESVWRRCELIHVAYAENDLGIFRHLGRGLPTRLVGTAHQPPSWWNAVGSRREVFRCLDALIVVSEAQRKFFDDGTTGRVHVIRHGVDLDFFRPPRPDESAATDVARRRCLFAGGWLRDGATLAHVVEEIGRRDPSIGFDLLLPDHFRTEPAYVTLANRDDVAWHSGITDLELRALHWQASLLLLPLRDCTVNNAMLEATACGLPIVSTDVGGAKEYTDPSFADLLPPGDVPGLVEAVLHVMNDPLERQRRSVAARLHAETKLSWVDAVRETLKVYDEVLTS